MMKIIKNIFLVLGTVIVVLSVTVSILLFVLNSPRYLLPLAHKIGLALGRDVTLGHLGLGVSSLGVTVDMGPVRIADNPDFTSQSFVTIDKIRVQLDMHSLMGQHRFDGARVLLQAPQIHLICSSQGQMNVSDFTVSQQAKTTSAVSTVVEKSEPARVSSDTRLDVLHIRSIAIENASISFIDQTENVFADLWLSSINAHLKDIEVDRRRRLIQVGGVDIQVPLAALDVKAFKSSWIDAQILQGMMGNLRLEMTRFKTTFTGDIDAQGALVFNDGRIKNMNIVHTLLEHSLGLGGTSIEGYLNTLGVSDTRIQKARLIFDWHEKTLLVPEALVLTDMFEFTATGSMDASRYMDMQTAFHLNPNLSRVLINELEGLRFLCDDKSRITVNASLKGDIFHLKYKPNKDFRKKSKKAWMAQGASFLKLLFH